MTSNSNSSNRSEVRRIDSMEINDGDMQILILSKKNGELVPTASIVVALSDNTTSDSKLSTSDTLGDSESSTAQSTDADIYKDIRNATVTERSDFAENKYISTSVLKILAKDYDKYIRQIVAENESTPPDTLRLLAKDDEWYVRNAVAENKSTPPDVLRTLAKDAKANAQCGVARNENTPVDVLRTLAKDNNVVVRRFVAENENTPLDALRTLAKDDEEDVRHGVAAAIKGNIPERTC